MDRKGKNWGKTPLRPFPPSFLGSEAQEAYSFRGKPILFFFLLETLPFKPGSENWHPVCEVCRLKPDNVSYQVLALEELLQLGQLDQAHNRVRAFSAAEDAQFLQVV